MEAPARYPLGAVVRSLPYGSKGEFVGAIVEDYGAYYLVRCLETRTYWHRLHEQLQLVDPQPARK